MEELRGAGLPFPRTPGTALVSEVLRCASSFHAIAVELAVSMFAP